MIYKFELGKDDLLTLFKAFSGGEIFFREVCPDGVVLEKVTALRKIIENSVWGKVNVKVENEE